MPDGVLTPVGSLRPLPHISPSRFVSLQGCALREVLVAAGESPRLPGSPSRHIGNIIHALYKRAEDGDFPPDDSNAFEAAWDEEVERAEARMRKTWLERPFLPLARHLGQLEEQRLTAMKRASQLARRRKARPSATAPSFERRLGSPDGKIKGELDSIILTTDGIVLGDHKTGPVHEDGPDGRRLKHSFQVQLKLYAALFVSRYDVWPIRLELADTFGNTFEVRFTHSECMALVDQAKAALELVNSQVQQIQDTKQSLTVLASPAPENCRFCVYRPICPAYREVTGACMGQAPDYPTDVFGKLINVRTGRWGLQTLEIETTGGRVLIRDLTSDTSRNPALLHLRPSNQIGVFNLRSTAILGLFAAADLTVVYSE
jgi:hypothetical protein